MKQYLALLCAAALVILLAGCGGMALASVGGAKPSGGKPAESAPEPALSDAAQPVPQPSDTDQPAPVPSDTDLTDYAVALAAYPAAAAYPEETDFISEDGSMDDEAYWAAYEAWEAVRYARPDVPKDVDRRFFRDSVRQFLSGEGNRVCSPLNIYMALSMTAELADGESRAQILRLLGADSVEALRTQARQLWDALYTDDGATARILGSSLWLNNQVKFREDTLKRLADNYYASSFTGKAGSPAFNAALQSWLNQQTRGLLQQQASGVKMSEDTALALAATLYYKAPWKDQFNRNGTQTDVFHAPGGDMQTPYMRNTFDRSDFYRGEHFSAFPLELSEGRMWLILPDEGCTVDSLLDSGAAMDFLAAPGDCVSASGAEVAVKLPRFDVSADMDLVEGLKTLGVTDVFSASDANFTPLTDAPVDISQILHAARVKIDEDGCEAAAYTVALVELTSALMGEQERIEFTLDRPFLFAVTDRTNLPLFVGVVNEPEAA